MTQSNDPFRDLCITSYSQSTTSKLKKYDILPYTSGGEISRRLYRSVQQSSSDDQTTEGWIFQESSDDRFYSCYNDDVTGSPLFSFGNLDEISLNRISEIDFDSIQNSISDNGDKTLPERFILLIITY